MAKYQCLHPKWHITKQLFFYDRRSGLELGFGSLLSRLISTKANVTKWSNRLDVYIKEHCSDLFFDQDTDIYITKARANIEAARGKVADLERQIQDLIISQADSRT